MRRRLTTTLAASAVSLGAVVAMAQPAVAAPADKPQVLSRWTQASESSYRTWLAARQARADWAAYAFDWSTDYCSSSPDNPLGFPFKLSCARHDFGYRNYKAAGSFVINKDRLDRAFYEDLKRVCLNYRGSMLSACNGTAWTYYQAVRLAG